MTTDSGIHVNSLNIWEARIISPFIGDFTGQTLEIIAPVVTQGEIGASLTTIPTIKRRLFLWFRNVGIFYGTELLFASLTLVCCLSLFSLGFFVGEIYTNLMEISVADRATILS